MLLLILIDMLCVCCTCKLTIVIKCLCFQSYCENKEEAAIYFCVWYNDKSKCEPNPTLGAVLLNLYRLACFFNLLTLMLSTLFHSGFKTFCTHRNYWSRKFTNSGKTRFLPAEKDVLTLHLLRHQWICKRSQCWLSVKIAETTLLLHTRVL